MLNMHHLINEYRPHQSRESLIKIMEEQLARRTAETEEIEATNNTTRQMLDKYRNLTSPQVEEVKTTSNGHTQDPVTIDAELEATKNLDLYMFEILNRS